MAVKSLSMKTVAFFSNQSVIGIAF